MAWLISLLLFSAPLVFALLRNKPIQKSVYINYCSYYYIIATSFWNLFTETVQRPVALFQIVVFTLSLWRGGKLLEKKELYLPEDDNAGKIIHPDTAWKCPHCGTVNDRFFVSCKKCGGAFEVTAETNEEVLS